MNQFLISLYNHIVRCAVGPNPNPDPNIYNLQRGDLVDLESPNVFDFINPCAGGFYCVLRTGTPIVIHLASGATIRCRLYSSKLFRAKATTVMTRVVSLQDYTFFLHLSNLISWGGFQYLVLESLRCVLPVYTEVGMNSDGVLSQTGEREFTITSTVEGRTETTLERVSLELPWCGQVRLPLNCYINFDNMVWFGKTPFHLLAPQVLQLVYEGDANLLNQPVDS